MGAKKMIQTDLTNPETIGDQRRLAADHPVLYPIWLEIPKFGHYTKCRTSARKR
jgi:hypothetical protein